MCPAMIGVQIVEREIQHMKRNGNTNANRTYNPQNTKPPIPLDVDEVDAVLERFIRQKYDQQLFTSGNTRPARKNDTGSTRSSEDQPPPLPPKPGKRFGFGLRSASSALPLQRDSPTSPPRSPQAPNAWGDEPLRVNKQSRVFGQSVGGNNDSFDSKLAQLRDMGFTDEKRNIHILKGLGGNLEKTIESLVRLGEGSAPISRSRTPIQPTNGAVGQPMPLTAQTTSMVNGASFTSNGSVSQQGTGSTGQQSSNDLNAPQQQTAPRSLSPMNPYQSQTQPYNPFDPSNDQRARMASMDQTFSGMQISQQPLFPNATGGYPNQSHPAPDPRLQTMTPPVPPVPHHLTQPNPYLQQSQNMNMNHNPFYHTNQQHIPASPTSFALNTQNQNTTPSYNSFQQTPAMAPPPRPEMGFSTTPSQIFSPQEQQNLSQQQLAQQQQQHIFFQQQISQQPQQYLFPRQQTPGSPDQYVNQQQQHPVPLFHPYQPQPLQPQQTGRVDKTSILALYNSPQLAPPPVSDRDNSTVSSVDHTKPSVPQNTVPHATHGTAPQRSVTMPVQSFAGSRNPFQSSINTNPNSNANPPPIGRHVSQESVDIGGFQTGRHSPDAFASLSARFVR
ncbi:MAG: hypothetical protein Q9164_005108 [Protoblastenia rupestris]